MRIFIYTLIALLFVNVAQSQVRGLQDMSRQGGFDNTFDPNLNDEMSMDSTTNRLNADSIISKISTWKMIDKYSRQIPVDYDTAYIGFRTYDPIFRKSISNNYLGNLGSPYVHNDYFERETEVDFYFFQSMDAYVRKPKDILYFNTTTPFTYLQYSQSDNKNTALEERFSVFHTRNVNPDLNFGFEYNSAQSMGQYASQATKHSYTNAFGSYDGDRYRANVVYLSGKYHNKENGGITNPEFLASAPSQSLEVVYGNDELQNERYNKTFEMAHEYLLGRKDSTSADSLKTDRKFVPWLSAQLITHWSDNRRVYIETKSDTTFFPDAFKSLGANTDSTYFRVLRNTFQLHAFESENSRFSFGTRAYITNEVMKATYTLTDSTEQTKVFTNVILGGELYRHKGSFWNWNASGKFYLVGRNAGDLLIKGKMDKPFVLFNDTVHLNASGFIRNSKADYFQENYFGNHYQWQNDFRQTQELAIKGSLDIPALKLNGGVNYSLLRNYLYNNENGLPDQFEGEFSIIGAWLKNYLKFWRFFWENKVVWQETSNRDVIHLPQLSAYSAIGYSHKLFKVLDMHIGAEVYYNSSFYADNYDPSTSRFYLQNEVMTGNYPYINLFGDLKLKRTRFFVKLIHVNTQLMNYNFYSTPNYPLNQMSFRFGLSWSFYD